MVYRRRHVNMCHHCYETGHNVRTCPKLRQDASKPEANIYVKEKLERVLRKNSVTTRACSYCNTSGHNVATCQKVRMDKVKAYTEAKYFRQTAIQLMEHYGIGVGCMLERNELFCEDKLFILEEIVWDNIIHFNEETSIRFLVNGSPDPYYNMAITPSFFDRIENGKTTVLVPASIETIRNGMPTDWLNGKSNVERTHNVFRIGK